MKPVKFNRRWTIWLALLGGAAWLALFGDKTPANSQLPQLAQSSLSNKSTGVNLATTSPKPAFNAQQNNINNTFSKQSLSAAESGMSLEVLVPREKLILNSQTAAGKSPNLFASGDWNPPPPVIKPLPPPPPMAPPLPFSFIGKKLEGGAWEVFLARGEQSFVVREGAVIENIYRVDTIKPPNLNLTYLPLGQGQSLIIGESQ